MIKNLQYLNIHIVDYHSFDDIKIHDVEKMKKSLSQEILNKIFTDEIIKHFSKLYTGIDRIEQKLKIILYDIIMRSIERIAQLFVIAGYFRNKGFDVYVFCYANPVTNIAFQDKSCRYPNLCPSFFFYMVFFSKLVIKALRSVSLIITGRLGLHSEKKIESQPEKAKIDLNTFEILYYTHQGVSYGNLFLKDHYYSNDESSPFFKKKILHVEISSKPVFNESVQVKFYETNNIPYIFQHYQWTDYISSAIDFFSFCWSNKQKMKELQKKNIQIKILLLLICYMFFKREYNALETFKNAKIALVGYDFLFPKERSLALQARGIKVVATQERFIQSFYASSSLILDEYLVIGDIVKERIAANPFCCIGQIKTTGCVRNDLLFEYTHKMHESKRTTLKKEYMIVLVLDHHSALDKFDNYAVAANNWHNNKAFYKDIIKLAIEFPNAYFVIRGKNDNWCNISYFKDIYDVISSLPNIEVNRNYNAYNISYILAAGADCVIAKHTSLGDECLAAGKPVLFYDFTPNCSKIASSFFDYEKHPIFVYSYDELENRIRSILENGFFMKEDRFILMRRRFYGQSGDGNVKKRLHAELLIIYKQQQNKLHW